MTRNPEDEYPKPRVRKSVRPIVVPTTHNFLAEAAADPKIRITNVRLETPPSTVSLDFSMTCDRPCISERGFQINVGTKVAYLGHLSGQAVKVRMEDGSEEVVHPHCFPELR